MRRMIAAGVVGLPAIAMAQSTGYTRAYQSPQTYRAAPVYQAPPGYQAPSAYQPPPAYQAPPLGRAPPAWRAHTAYRGLPAWQAQPGQVQPGQVQPGQVQPGQVQPAQMLPALRIRPAPAMPVPVAPAMMPPGAPPGAPYGAPGAPPPAIGEQVMAPDGRVAYAIRTERGNPDELRTRSILAVYNRGASSRVLVAPRPSSDPRQNLTGFYHLVLGPDGRTLYFETLAWQAIGAVHALSLDRGQIRFIAPGRLACVIPGGQWQGYLLVQQRRPLVFGGGYDGFWLYDVNGREIGPAALGADSARYCQSAVS